MYSLTRTIIQLTLKKTVADFQIKNKSLQSLTAKLHKCAMWLQNNKTKCEINQL